MTDTPTTAPSTERVLWSLTLAVLLFALLFMVTLWH